MLKAPTYLRHTSRGCTPRRGAARNASRALGASCRPVAESKRQLSFCAFALWCGDGDLGDFCAILSLRSSFFSLSCDCLKQFEASNFLGCAAVHFIFIIVCSLPLFSKDSVGLEGTENPWQCGAVPWWQPNEHQGKEGHAEFLQKTRSSRFGGCRSPQLLVNTGQKDTVCPKGQEAATFARPKAWG